MRKLSRGRAIRPRGYYLLRGAKQGGFEVGGQHTMPVLSVPGDYVTVDDAGVGNIGQVEMPKMGTLGWLIAAAVVAVAGYMVLKPSE